MTDGKHGGAAGAETSGIGATAAPGRERRMTAGRKRDAVLRLLRGEPLEIVAWELSVTAADLSAWRDAFLEAGVAGLKSRARDDRDDKIDRLQSKLGELLYAKIDRLEAGGSCAPLPGGGRSDERRCLDLHAPALRPGPGLPCLGHVAGQRLPCLPGDRGVHAAAAPGTFWPDA